MYLNSGLNVIMNYVLDANKPLSGVKNLLLSDASLDITDLKFKKCYYKDNDNNLKYIPEMNIIDAAAISVFDGSFERTLFVKNDEGVIVFLSLKQIVTNEVLISREMYYSKVTDSNTLSNIGLVTVEYETITIGEIDYKYRDSDGKEVEIDSKGVLTPLRKVTSINKYLGL